MENRGCLKGEGTFSVKRTAAPERERAISLYIVHRRKKARRPAQSSDWSDMGHPISLMISRRSGRVGEMQHSVVVLITNLQAGGYRSGR